MTSLTTFNFRSNDVRTVTDENGEPWFIAKDICDVQRRHRPCLPPMWTMRTAARSI